MDAFQYALKKNVHNKSIVREVDQARQRELWQWVGVGFVLVIVLLFSAWRHLDVFGQGYRLDRLQRQLAAEEHINRHLRLEIESLKSPTRIEQMAIGQLHLVRPTAEDVLIIERVVATPPPPTTVVARGEARETGGQ
jgi:cell division protein FtsL